VIRRITMREIEFLSPRTLREAVKMLARVNGEAKCLAGGTDLIDQLRSGRRSASVILDVKGIPELTTLRFMPRSGLRVGAAVPCAQVAEDPRVQRYYPIIVQACQLIGSVQIQNRASVGGNICNAAPSADTVPAFLALDATAVAASPRGRREVPLDQFFVGPGKTVLASDELLVEIKLPTPPPHSAGSYLRFIPREEMDIAVVGVGSFVVLESSGGLCKEARIALAAVAPTPVRAREAEAFLQGRPLTPEALAQAGELAARSAKPISDIRGTAEYRIELVKVLTQRTLELCRKQLGLS
jgi:carbon-monoxide dehydrogenase medium subunit